MDQNLPCEAKESAIRRGKNKIFLTFSINDCPLSVWKDFTKDLIEYNDVYWSKLKDLIRKAEAYDTMVRLGLATDIDRVDEQTKDDKDECVVTFGGKQNA